MIAETNHVPARYSTRTAFWWHVAVFNTMVAHWDTYGRLATITDLASVFGKTKGALHSVLQTMMKRGYVETTKVGSRKTIYTPIRHPAFSESKFMPRLAEPHAHKSIVVESDRHLTSHARLTYCETCIVLEHGALIQHLFKPQYFEVLYFSEHPEIRALHDGTDWDWAEVRHLVLMMSETNAGKPMTVVVDTAYGADKQGYTYPTNQPFPTQTTRQTFALCNPFLLSYMNQENPPRLVNEPIYTVPTMNAIGLVTPQLVSTNYYDDRTIPVDEPLPTQVTARKWALLMPFISEMYGKSVGRDVSEPLSTITGGVAHHALISPFIAELHGTAIARGVNKPLMGIVGSGLHHALISPFMVVMKDSQAGYLAPRGMNEPLTTLVAAGSQHALITPFVTSLNHSNVRNTPVGDPLATVMPQAHPALVAPPFVMAYYGNLPSYALIDDPIPTVTAVQRHALIEPEAIIDDCGFRMLEPEELKRGMSFPDSYVILGNKRDQVKQVGNAVCCLVAQALVERCVEALAS